LVVGRRYPAEWKAVINLVPVTNRPDFIAIWISMPEITHAFEESKHEAIKKILVVLVVCTERRRERRGMLQ
jgi:hypothetical protein